MFDYLANYGIVSFLDFAKMVGDIALVSYLLYKLFSLIRGTRAVPLINGIILLYAANRVARFIGLYTIQFLLESIFIAASVALPIIFQPELRRALEHLGRGRLLAGKRVEEPRDDDLRRLIEHIVRAAEILGRNKHGALIVIERETGLGEYTDQGIKIDGLVSTELLTNIFMPGSPLHDKAVIIRGNRVAAAGCLLPSLEVFEFTENLGTRHRAGVGVTEQSDAAVVIVSEETGTISFAQGGKIVRPLDGKALREMLSAALAVDQGTGRRGFWNWGAAS